MGMHSAATKLLRKIQSGFISTREESQHVVEALALGNTRWSCLRDVSRAMQATPSSVMWLLPSKVRPSSFVRLVSRSKILPADESILSKKQLAVKHEIETIKTL